MLNIIFQTSSRHLFGTALWEFFLEANCVCYKQLGDHESIARPHLSSFVFLSNARGRSFHLMTVKTRAYNIVEYHLWFQHISNVHCLYLMGFLVQTRIKFFQLVNSFCTWQTFGFYIILKLSKFSFCYILNSLQQRMSFYIYQEVFSVTLKVHFPKEFLYHVIKFVLSL